MNFTRPHIRYVPRTYSLSSSNSLVIIIIATWCRWLLMITILMVSCNPYHPNMILLSPHDQHENYNVHNSHTNLMISTWSSWSSHDPHDLLCLLRFLLDRHGPHNFPMWSSWSYPVLISLHTWSSNDSRLLASSRWIPLYQPPLYLLRTGWTSARCRSRLAGCAAAPASRSPGWRRSSRRGWSRRLAWRAGQPGWNRWWIAPSLRWPLPPPSPPPSHAGPGSSFSGT